MGSSTKSHVVIFPFMAHSHSLPMIDLAKGFCLQQVRVTIVTIPSNVKHISPKIKGFPLISLVELNFPDIDGLSEVNHCENLSQIPSMDFFVSFLTATIHLHNPFQQLLQSMADSGDLPLCVVSDHFLGWTLEICRQFGVPRMVFHATGIVPLLISKTIMANTDYTASSSSHMCDIVRRLLPNLPFDLTPDDVPDVNIPPNADTNPFLKFMAEAEEADLSSWGVFSNTFLELEMDHKSALESFYVSGAKAWCLGPSFLYGRQTSTSNYEDESASLMKWLDARAAEAAPVIYAAFGSQATVTEAEMEAMALGLEESGCPYVLVIRSNTWCAPEGVGSKGVIVRGFVDQVGVLFHTAIGGFLSHCGWNSVMESLAAEVPILTWPMASEQKLNAKYLVEGLGIGISMEKGEDKNLIYCRENISASVRELMIGEKGKKAGERARELGNLARRAVEDGGSSHTNMKILLHQLVALRSKHPE